ncbi:nickel pincer cofactor biosynthesis protein LarB [soil metagenome]
MRPNEVRSLLEEVRSGAVEVEEAAHSLERSPVEDLGFARLDLHRELRQGMPEAIYAEHKTPAQVVAIAAKLLEQTSAPVIATRVTQETATELLNSFPDAQHEELARLVILRSDEHREPKLGIVAVVSAGTSDLPVAEEATATARALGAEVDSITDVGVAGVHRVLAVEQRLRDAGVVVVVAGMEGALPSLVGGLTPAPVVAVPTSVGYGASFQGLAALLGMLNSCAAGVAVTNIDNGFGAGVFAVKALLHNRK